MRSTTHNIACKHTLNLSSTLFRPSHSLRTTHLLSLGKCHVSTTSKINGEEALRQACAKQWYDRLYTKFHTINGHTSPTFKSLLADIAGRAGHTVNEGDGAANPRWDWTENNPILKGEAEQRRRVAKSAGDSVNEDDNGVRETRRDWFEDLENEEEEATDDEDFTENRLDRYLDAVEKDAKALLEQIRVLKGEKKEVNRHKEKHPENFNKLFLEQMRVLKVEKEEGVNRPEEKHKKILIESIWWDPDDEFMCPEQVDVSDDDELRSELWQRASNRCHRSCHCEAILKTLVDSRYEQREGNGEWQSVVR